MKEKMSGRHDKHDSKRSEPRSKDSSENRDSYRHVLKERHYKDDEKNKRRDRDRSKDLKHSSRSQKRKRSSSPQSSNPKSSFLKSQVTIDTSKNHRSHKDHDDDLFEYEELSRRKKKLERELRALDLEEAAEREAENKKSDRNKSEKNSRKAPEIKIKKERTSDDERNSKKSLNDKKRDKKSSNDDRDHKKSSKSKSQHASIKTEKVKNKGHASGSSDDEKGWGKSNQEAKPTNKEKPNFATSGKLAEETNTYNGVVIKYNEPSEARKPKRRWRLYPFKGDSDLPFIPIHRQSAYLFGRTRLIADIPIDHPSCSKQHAVLQFRLVPYKREDGTTGRRVRPYIIDLESSNGTFVNNSRIDPRCYVELVEKDVIKFGYSSREYVLLHEESKYNAEDDDVIEGD